MAKTTRQYAFHKVNASLLATALALPAGLTSAVAAPLTHSTSRPHAAPSPAGHVDTHRPFNHRHHVVH
ncbi:MULTISPECIES: hypothetical protein [Streptomyces]|uniref:Secreted protein n=2 Tax=Streptomyces TaxID=1883 RepID=A0ABV9IUA8_9ACTN